MRDAGLALARTDGRQVHPVALDVGPDDPEELLDCVCPVVRDSCEVEVDLDGDLAARQPPSSAVQILKGTRSSSD